jgi:hypothetical protein
MPYNKHYEDAVNMLLREYPLTAVEYAIALMAIDEMFK